MKKKRTTGLSCERARAFPIEKALAKLGHFPTRETDKEAWFLSPLRSETQASFKVCKKLNRWYDHGEGIGGNVINLICQIKPCSVKSALAFIKEQMETSFFLQQHPILKEEVQELETNHTITILKVKELKHPALAQYLKVRGISIEKAKELVKEVHYQVKGKNYFAIGLQNDSGGWELRNKYLKNSCSPKDMTSIKKGHSKLLITEGMFDILSLTEINKKLISEYDFLIMNSIGFLEKVKLISREYEIVDLYLDNDSNGKLTTENLLKVSNKFKDKSKLYDGFKDMNEWLIHCAKKGISHKAQDVFLLPQKQTCFTPDGCKENKK
ncbi:toprim domain-containing protein [Cellulophaga sp. Hel_I_12]|uniref:toprim domain-containing protein n=1 Tax=Cellulophaga sp. Hel_I_12 TaxID=1249972 RepID=UPI0009DDF2F0|nr:toprim domain-containing protein [Cellulophaga sp. Hel_I_12]